MKNRLQRRCESNRVNSACTICFAGMLVRIKNTKSKHSIHMEPTKSAKVKLRQGLFQTGS